MEAGERPMKVRKTNDFGTTQCHDAARTVSNGQDRILAAPSIEGAGQNASHLGTIGFTDSNSESPQQSEQAPAPAEQQSGSERDHAAGRGDQVGPVTSIPLSKNQQKKLRKKLDWESRKDEFKALRKAKEVAKRERARALKQAAVAEGRDVIADDHGPQPKRQTAIQLPITVIIDCDFDEFMSEKERLSLAQQVTRSYSDNKNSVYAAHLTICSFRGKLREWFEGTLSNQHKSWRRTRFLDSDFVEASKAATSWMQDSHGGVLAGTLSKYSDLADEGLEALKQAGEVIYLTADAEETIAELKPYSTYIIGGLVDRNREKGICFKRATQRGIKTARLPIGDYLSMSSRKILATNHVNEIMLRWLETGDWAEAFLKVIPKRKGGVLKGAPAAVVNKDDGDDDENDTNNHKEGAKIDQHVHDLDARKDESTIIAEESDRTAET